MPKRLLLNPAQQLMLKTANATLQQAQREMQITVTGVIAAAGIVKAEPIELNINDGYLDIEEPTNE